MAIVLALISAVVYGVSDYSGGRAARSSPVLAVTLVAQCAGLCVSTTIVVVTGDPFPPAADVGWGAAAGCMSLVGGAAFYAALAGGAMTVVAPVTAVISAAVPVAAGVADGERPSVLASCGILVAIVAVALVSGITGRADRPTTRTAVASLSGGWPGSARRRGTSLRRPHQRRVGALAVLAGVGFGLLFVFLDRTSDDSGSWPILIGQLTSVPILAAVVAVRRVRFVGFPRRYALAVVAGALAVTANVSYLLATREGLLSLVAVITALYPASTVALATIVDHERLSPSQIAGLALVLGALAMVTAGA